MHVVAIHHIHDPAGFQKAGAQALKNEPPEFKLPIRVGINDHSIGIVSGRDPSVGEIGKLADSVVGPYSNNEYFEMTVRGV
jgi:hypothetical protein